MSATSFRAMACLALLLSEPIAHADPPPTPAVSSEIPILAGVGVPAFPIPMDAATVPSGREFVLVDWRGDLAAEVTPWWETLTERPRRRPAGSSPVRFLLTQSEGDDRPHVGTSNGDDVDIAKPGPDMGDFPNSAYTLRQGRVQLEMAPLTFNTQNAANPSAYAWPYLFRYGITDDVEFRLLGTGLTSLINPEPTTGFGVITFDTKIHLWNDRMEYFIPAVSFEAMLQTEWGSEAFQAGTEPSLNINMDFPFTEKTNFEATVGYSGSLTDVNFITRKGANPSSVLLPSNIYIFSIQAAIEQQVTEKFSTFVHGYYSVPVDVSGDVGVVLGVGYFYQHSKRVMTFGSANAGLTNVPAPFLTQWGVAIAF